jgi:hypothetical protein
VRTPSHLPAGTHHQHRTDKETVKENGLSVLRWRPGHLADILHGWQQRANVRREIARPARGARRLRSGEAPDSVDERIEAEFALHGQRSAPMGSRSRQPRVNTAEHEAITIDLCGSGRSREGQLFAVAAMNKCLARSNKSHERIKATKKQNRQ